MRRTSLIGEVMIELSEIDSTNNYAMSLINEGMAEHGMTIKADYQTQGKGQQGNTWLSEDSKNLLCSFILDTQSFEIHRQFILNMSACLAIANYLQESIGLPNISIKWPNDIYAGNKKMAGILIENTLRGSCWSHAIVGIGLNINQSQFPTNNLATSMSVETGQHFKVKQVLTQLLPYVNHYYKIFVSEPERILEEYNNFLYKAGEPMLFKKHHELVTGKILGVDETGAIEIEIDGKVKHFKHKEIDMVLN
ncbi:MAG: biotin--[acetyl-CoA-carboxylase] ligase [Bacteroidetes bacterium]|nr:biotin--[acetyl-CoA-carboxylase] ligase [Bacteroidota bacterium]